MKTIDEKAPLILVTISDEVVQIEDRLLNRTFAITVSQAKELEVALRFALLDRDVVNGEYPKGGE